MRSPGRGEASALNRTDESIPLSADASPLQKHPTANASPLQKHRTAGISPQRPARVPGDRRSIRLPDYDYAQPGAYFVTICVQDRTPLFGEVSGGIVRLDQLGQIVAACWAALPAMFPHIILSDWVIMPNHFHGIIIIHRRGEASAAEPIGSSFILPADASSLRDARPRATAPNRPNGTNPGSVGAIVQNFKSVSTRKINTLRGTPGLRLWQRNYYEHILRSESDLARVQTYIRENPLCWDLDRENPAFQELKS